MTPDGHRPFPVTVADQGPDMAPVAIVRRLAGNIAGGRLDPIPLQFRNAMAPRGESVSS